MKIIVFAFATTLAVAPALGHAEAVRLCEKGAIPKYLSVNSDTDIAPHRLFALPQITYPPKTAVPEWGFKLLLMIDETGKIICRNPDIGSRGSTIITPQRQTVLDALGDWRYTPFLTKGKPASAYIEETVAEGGGPDGHVAMPVGALESVHVLLSRSDCFGSCPDYSVNISGDGTVVYMGNASVDIHGTHTYHVPVADVQALLNLARDKDIWSMRSAYVANLTDGPTYRVTLHIGGKTKTIADYVGAEHGMPFAVSDFEAAIDKTARSDQWIHLSLAGIELLASEGFDFKSQQGADLLAMATNNPRTTDNAAISALIGRGAPINGGRVYQRLPTDGQEVDVLDAAIRSKRDALIDLLIDKGALLQDGKLDQARIDSAFGLAIGQGQMAIVQKFWAVHPDLTYSDDISSPAENGPTTKTVPVTLLLDPGWSEDEHWQGFTIAQFLLAQGCNINASDGSDKTLLHIAARSGSVDFARYLISHGANLEARDDKGDTPLNDALSDDMILALLDSGANPLNRPTYGTTLAEEAVLDGRQRVLAWLLERGIMAPIENPRGGFGN